MEIEPLNPKTYPYPIVVHLGSRNKLDEIVAPCDDWDRADYRYPNPVPEWRRKHATACRLAFSGSQIVKRNGSTYRRGRITWVRDDEPDTYSPCLILVDWRGEPIQGSAYHASL